MLKRVFLCSCSKKTFCCFFFVLNMLIYIYLASQILRKNATYGYFQKTEYKCGFVHSECQIIQLITCSARNSAISLHSLLKKCGKPFEKLQPVLLQKIVNLRDQKRSNEKARNEIQYLRGVVHDLRVNHT